MLHSMTGCIMVQSGEVNRINANNQIYNNKEYLPTYLPTFAYLGTCKGGLRGIRVCGSAVWAGGEGADLGSVLCGLQDLVFSK